MTAAADHATTVIESANTPLIPRRVLRADDPPPVDDAAGSAARYQIRLATNHQHRSAASFLMRKAYQWRGYSTDIVREEPAGATLVAFDKGRIVATVSVGLDSPKGMAAQSLYPEEVANLRAEGARLCEFTRLAVDRNGNATEVLAMLFHVAYLYAKRVHGATHLLAEVNPRHLRFYSRMLGFTRVGPQRMCRRVGAPAVLISLLLDHAEQQIARYREQPELAKTGRSLYPRFFSAHEEEEFAERLVGIDPAVAPAPAALCA